MVFTSRGTYQVERRGFTIWITGKILTGAGQNGVYLIITKVHFLNKCYCKLMVYGNLPHN